MSEDIAKDFSMWFSTYGLLTAQRILERFNINLSNEELVAAIKNPLSIYYQLLRIPLKNVFNGIILQQIQDYQVYAQKLFIDYLLSSEGSNDDEAPGAHTRDDLEAERTQLLAISEDFSKQELEHQKLIAESQAQLIKLASAVQGSLQNISQQIRALLQAHNIIKEEKLIQQAIRSAMIQYEKIDQETLATSAAFWAKTAEVLEIQISEALRKELTKALITFGDPRDDMQNILSVYLEQAEGIGINFRSYRSQFYDLILRAVELIKLLPDYHIDEIKDEENRSSLYFDALIGG